MKHDSERVLAHDWFPRALPENVRMGERSWLHSAFAFLHCRSRRALAVDIGDDTGLYKGTDFCLGPNGELSIGHHVTVVGAIFCTNGRIIVGNHTLIAHRVVIASRAIAVPDESNQSQDADIVIGNNVWIGANATILGGVRIGDNAIVGAGAVVDIDVPANTIAAGCPAKVVRRF